MKWSDDDRVLDVRIRSILAKLEVLSDAPAGTLGAFVSRGAPTSSAPPEAIEDRDTSAPPPKDRSLFDWYLWQFHAAGDEERLRLLTYLAERDYEERLRGLPGHRVALRPEREEEEEAKFVLEAFAGMDVLEVAVIGRYRVGWVKTVRQRGGMRPEDGRPASIWRTLDESARFEACRRAQSAGESQERAAADLGITARTLRKYWSLAREAVVA